VSRISLFVRIYCGWCTRRDSRVTFSIFLYWQVKAWIPHLVRNDSRF